MNNEWTKTLIEHGLGAAQAGADADNASHRTVDCSADEPQLVDLAPLCILEVTGTDAEAFLQGQFCNDLAAASATRGQITGYCTPKGRLLALPTVIGFENGYRMILPDAVKDSFVKRLTMFIMRSDVVVSELTDWVCTGVIADSSDNIGPIAETLGALPASPMDVATESSRQLIRWHDDHVGNACKRYLLIASVADQTALWQQSGGLQKKEFSRWRLGDITAGVPMISAAVADAFVPQMLNLQLIDALSFTKGCYPGQEIVARMQYLGKLKRHMRQFRISVGAEDAAVLPEAGQALSIEGDENAGIVVDAISVGGDFVAVLAVMKVSANTATVKLGDLTLDNAEHPYELPTLSCP